jgi:singapore isolate B (sub-type 7) whole genome shotgun sequence assembly, scaffold_2
VAVGDVAAEQEGCRLQGSIIVPRMSGNFHISCHGPQASILPAEINVSHKVWVGEK